MGEQFDVRQVGMGPWNAQQMSQNLTAAGLEVWAVQADLCGIERGDENGAAGAGDGGGAWGNPVLRWMVDNVTIVRDANANMKPDKAQPQQD